MSSRRFYHIRRKWCRFWCRIGVNYGLWLSKNPAFSRPCGFCSNIAVAIKKTSDTIAKDVSCGDEKAIAAFDYGQDFYKSLIYNTQLVCNYVSRQQNSKLLDLQTQKISDPILDGKALFGSMTPNERIAWNRMTDHNKQVNLSIEHARANGRQLDSFKEIVLKHARKVLLCTTTQEVKL